MNLIELLRASPVDINQVAEYFNANVLPQAVADANANFSPRRLVKRSRAIEPLPTDTRQLSSYRTRIGTMLEYSLSTSMDKILSERYGGELLLTFAVAHEYPDFYLRDAPLEPVLRMEMKAVDAGSDEQAARFDVLTSEINPNRDLILFIGWEWLESKTRKGIIREYPHIFTFLGIPAIEIARERDRRLIATGGRIEDGKVLVPSKKHPGTFVPDPGNYGKLWRIVHHTRRDAEDLTEPLRRFQKFLDIVDAHAQRRRTNS